ncbi:MAG: DUF87 domain-containing protein [Acidobacteriota bacterium]
MANGIPDRVLIDALLEAHGQRHNAALRRRFDLLYLHPDRQDVESILSQARTLEFAIKVRNVELHPFLPSPAPETLQDSGLIVGRIPGYKEPVFIPLNRHVYVAGTTGAGKTTVVEWLVLQAIRKDMHVIIFDPQGHFSRDIVPRIGFHRCYIVTGDTFRVNPFDPPPTTNIRDWLGWLGNINRELFSFRRGSENFFSVVALAMVESGARLNMKSFLAAAIAAQPKQRYSREYDYFDSVKNTVEGLLASLPPIGVASSAGFSQIFSRPVTVFDFASLEHKQTKKYVTLLALSWLMASRSGQTDVQPDTLIVCDEIHELASVELKNQSDIGEPFFIEAMRRSRTKGFTFVTLDQNPAHTHPIVRANSGTKIVMMLDGGEDKFTMAADLDLNAEQRAYLSALESREALVKLPYLPTSFLVQVPEVIRVDAPDQSQA